MSPRVAPKDSGARSTTLLSPRVRLALAALLFVGALAYFAFLAFRSATVYYLTVGELEARGPTADGRLVRVAGKLVPGSFERSSDPLDVRFQLRDQSGHLLPVAYRGEVGQIFFNEHSEIILEGKYTDQRFFDTETLIVKCPSKYIALEESGQQAPYTTETYKASGT
ncbi:MAG: cytochrome c maturation protein CcmE [Chloroflexi bacterium]|nr:cytochrome c maturation protein CcmE [Chloroflexota bacterium]